MSNPKNKFKPTKLDEDVKPLSPSKQPLSRHFTTLTMTFMVLVLAANGLLFIWSNNCDGAYVRLRVYPTMENGINSTVMLKNYEEFENKITTLKNLLKLKIDEYDSPILFPHIPSNITSKLSIDEEIFSFTLLSSVEDFWDSKSYALTILISLFSGIWPYIKILFLLIVWLHPLKHDTRSRILFVLDQLGKFSFIDLYVSVFMIVSFYVVIKEQINNLALNIIVIVEPDIGLTTFVIGTMISMVFTHVFVYLNTKYGEAPILANEVTTSSVKDPINQNSTMSTSYNNISDYENYQEYEDPFDNAQVFLPDKNNNSNNNQMDLYEDSHKPLFLRNNFLPISWFGIGLRSLLLSLIILTFYSTLISVFVTPVRYNIEGLTGLFISNNIRTYTTWEVGVKVPDSTDMKQCGLFLSIIFIITVIILPILNNALMISLWLIPLNKILYNFLYNLIIVIQSWSALDVFVIGSIAASLELDNVSKWIIDQNFAQYCGPNSIIQNVTHMDCFSVTGTLAKGTWWMLYSVISFWIMFFYSIYWNKKSHTLYQYNIKSPIGLGETK